MARHGGEGKSPWGLGLLWIAGWLFSIGFLHLGFMQGVLALAIWPYMLGVFFGGF